MISISNRLIIISAIVWIWIAYYGSDFYLYGMNTFSLEHKDYAGLLFQFLFYSFIHGGISHLFFNSIFLYLFGNKVENIMGSKHYIWMFIFALLFNGIMILLLSSGNTYWISGFNSAILWFYICYLYARRDPEYKWWITAIIINIAVGLSAEVSFVAHFFWVIAWVFYYFLYAFIKKRT